MLFGIDRKFRIVVDEVELKGEFPLPKDDREIELELAKRLKYVSKGSLSPDVVYFENMCCILNHVIKEKPKELTDFAEVYQFEWTVKVFNEYSSAKKKFDESLKKNNGSGNDSDIGERPGHDPEPVSNEKLQPKTRRVT